MPELRVLQLVGAFALVLALAGLAKRIGLLRPEHARPINSLIINLTFPAFVFTAAVGGNVRADLLLFPALAWIAMLVLFGIAYVLGRGLSAPGPLLGAVLIVSAIGNTGYLGYPVSFAAAGRDGLLDAVFYDLLGTAVAMLTVGLAICAHFGAGDRAYRGLRELLLFPGNWAFVAGLLVRSIDLPDVLIEAASLVGQATIPLVMLSIGTSLRLGHVRRYPGPLAASLALKLALSPLLLYALGKGMGLEGTDLLVLTLQGAMPSAMMSVVFGARYGLDTDFLSSAVLLSTVGAMATIPIITLLGT